MFEAAGSYAPILLGLGGLGALLALAFTAVGLTGRRVPLLAWLTLPMLTVAVGAFASWSNVGDASAELAQGVPNVFDVANSRLADSLGPRWLAHWVAAAVCAVSAWGAAVAALLKPAGETRTTPMVAIVGLLLTLGGMTGMAIYTIANELGTQAVALTALVGFAGLGASAGAFRRALHEASYRVASLRFASGLMVVFAAAHASRGLTLQGRMDVLRSHQGVAFEQLAEATMKIVTYEAQIQTLAWVVFGIALIIGMAAFIFEMAEVVTRFTLVDATVTLMLLAAVGGVRVVESGAEYALSSTGRLDPVPQLVAELGFQLPTSSVSGFTTAFTVHLEGEAFGHIYRYGPDPSWVPPELAEGETMPPTPQIWYRAFRWTGDSWEADSTPMEQTTNDVPYDPLLAAPGSTSAQEVLRALRHLGGQAQILLRSNELNPMIPREIAFTEAHWVPLAIGGEVDFATEAYAHTERYDLYWGPARFFGPGADEAKPVHRLDALFDGAGPSAIRASISERTRLDHIMTLCLAAEFDPAAPPEEDVKEEAPTAREGVRCDLVDSDIDPLIAGAVAALGMPTADNLRMIATADPALPEGTAAALERELAAMAWCAPAVQDDMGLERPITGRLAGTFPIDEKGRAGYIEWDDRRVIDLYDMRRCVKERIDKVRFPEYTPPPPPEDPEAELPPAPQVTFELTYR